MSKKYPAKFLGHMEGDNEYLSFQIFAFEVNIKSQNTSEVLFFTTAFVDDCFDMFNEDSNSKYYEFTHQLRIANKSEFKNFNDLKGLNCLVEVEQMKITKVIKKITQKKVSKYVK